MTASRDTILIGDHARQFPRAGSIVIVCDVPPGILKRDRDDASPSSVGSKSVRIAEHERIVHEVAYLNRTASGRLLKPVTRMRASGGVRRRRGRVTK
jgi:hypothetical protein